jgi:hypothetical protein
MLIPYGLNPNETWEVDFAAERARWMAEVWRAAAASAREEVSRLEKKPRPPDGSDPAEVQLRVAEDLERRVRDLEAELATYAPRSGPSFIVGHIPNAMRAEILGELAELRGMPDGAERVKRDVAWSEKVVRYSVRGHTGLRDRRGAELAFVSEPLDGRPSPARATLEAYQPILGDLANLALRSQRLDGAGKNG